MSDSLLIGLAFSSGVLFTIFTFCVGVVTLATCKVIKNRREAKRFEESQGIRLATKD